MEEKLIARYIGRDKKGNSLYMIPVHVADENMRFNRFTRF
jgi:hypothetical protein